jgi:excisionase family DNA binding protein
MELMTVKEVADLLRLSVNQVYLLKNTGEIPGSVRVGKAIRFDKAVIEAWIKKQTES